jgi:hypothetical protein
MMHQRSNTLATLLTYSGTLPLIACVITVLLQPDIVYTGLFALTYGATIISFICGIHWAAHLFFPEKCSRNLLITSNVVTLAAWVSLLLTSPQSVSFLLQIFCFLYLLTLDMKLRVAGIIPEWFYRLRRNASIIVVLCLSVLAGLA